MPSTRGAWGLRPSPLTPKPVAFTVAQSWAPSFLEASSRPSLEAQAPVVPSRHLPWAVPGLPSLLGRLSTYLNWSSSRAFDRASPPPSGQGCVFLTAAGSRSTSAAPAGRVPQDSRANAYPGTGEPGGQAGRPGSVLALIREQCKSEVDRQRPSLLGEGPGTHWPGGRLGSSSKGRARLAWGCPCLC